MARQFIISRRSARGAVHGIPQLRTGVHGFGDSGRLAGRRAGCVRAGQAAQKDPPKDRARCARLLHLFWFLVGTASIGSLVVHVPPRLDLVWLPDDPGGVLAGHGEMEITRVELAET